MFEECVASAHSGRAAFLFGEEFRMASLVEYERCSKDLFECTTGDDCTRVGKEASVSET